MEAALLAGLGALGRRDADSNCLIKRVTCAVVRPRFGGSGYDGIVYVLEAEILKMKTVVSLKRMLMIIL